ncbi:MAG TPA: hypothetical protein VKA92_13330 [Segetibacter sp.]|nr:hypothetical protein [Segetibacter sp.]
MEKNDYILQELMEISDYMTNISKTNVYSVSPTYFDDLSEEITRKIMLNKERAYNFPPASTPYVIPEDYFTNLPGLIFQNVVNHQQLNGVIEEMEAIAPLLNTIDKKQLYSIPPDFFDKMQIPLPEMRKRKTKVVSVNRWKIFLRISAAAVVTSLLAIGVYTITGREFNTTRNRNARNEVKNLSNEEIVNFLKNNSSENITSVYKETSKHVNAIKSSLKEISDTEIQRFLKETGESDEI